MSQYILVFEYLSTKMLYMVLEMYLPLFRFVIAPQILSFVKYFAKYFLMCLLIDVTLAAFMKICKAF